MEMRRYRNDRPKLGLVEIINNLDEEQKATQKDVQNLTRVFRWIGMEVQRPHLNLKAKDLGKKVKEILDPKRDLKEYNILIVAIICHGEKGDKLISADNKVFTTIQNLLKKIDDIEDMIGRPKVLILDCCRGDKPNYGIRITFNTTKSGHNTENELSQPNHGDVLIAYATVPGKVSITEPTGSPFITMLTAKLIELAENDHLVDILTVVQNDLSQKYPQMAQITSTFLKQLYLEKNEKIYFDEGIHQQVHTKYRKFGDKNGWGEICYLDGTYVRCNFQDGKQKWSGRYVYERPEGKIQEVELDEGAEENNWTGEGRKYNIRTKWSYEGQFKSCKKGSYTLDFRHGTGVLHFDDGSFYIGNFEFNQFNGYGCKIGKNGNVMECGLWKDDKIIKSFKK